MAQPVQPLPWQLGRPPQSRLTPLPAAPPWCGVCKYIKTLTGVCKLKNPAQSTSIKNPPLVCKNQNTPHISPCVQTKLDCVWGIRRGCRGSAQHWGRAWHSSMEERIPERQEIVEKVNNSPCKVLRVGRGLLLTKYWCYTCVCAVKDLQVAC